jgi:hypothetical protein
MRFNILAAVLGLTCVLACPANWAVYSVSEFKDVPVSAPYYGDLQSLVERYAVFDDVTTTTFAPDKPLTRADFVTLLDNAFESLIQVQISADVSDLMIHPVPSSVNVSAVSQFKDVRQTDAYYQRLKSLVELYGIVLADSNTTFAPQKPVTMAEVRRILGGAVNYKELPSTDGVVTRGAFAQYLNGALEKAMNDIIRAQARKQ